MKKSLLAAAILASVSGAASAATSVTLYGVVDVGYGYTSTTSSAGSWQTGATPATVATVTNSNATAVISNITTDDDLLNFASAVHVDPTSGATVSNINTYGFNAAGNVISSSKTSSKIKQNDGYHDGSRLGVKGQEDLGNGLSAIFNVEMRFAADTGTLGTQLDHSYVGLKGSFGEVTMGRRININDDIFGYASDKAKKVDLQVADGPWNNNLSYRGAFGALTFGADITTGENNSSYVSVGNGYKVSGDRDQQYAIGAEYTIAGFGVGAGYEHSAVGKNAYALGLKYQTGPVKMYARVSRSKQTVNDFWLASASENMDKTIKATGFALGVDYSITPNDVLGVSYSQLNKKSHESFYTSLLRNTGVWVGDVSEKSRLLSVDYTHSLSKRTSIYAGVSLGRTKTSASATQYSALGVAGGTSVLPSYTSAKTRSYNIGLKHSF